MPNPSKKRTNEESYTLQGWNFYNFCKKLSIICIYVREIEAKCAHTIVASPAKPTRQVEQRPDLKVFSRFLLKTIYSSGTYNKNWWCKVMPSSARGFCGALSKSVNTTVNVYRDPKGTSHISQSV